MHLTVAMFGDPGFFGKFGKQGTENDLLVRNQSDSGSVITYVAPGSDKVQPLVQAAAMADFPVVVVNEITPAIGEILVLLEELGIENGLVVTDYHEGALRNMTRDMKIADFDFAGKDENVVREKILAFSPKRAESPVIVPIDNYFPVKGVGTVVLGLVKSGRIRQYDRLGIYPVGKEVLVKSMQSQDRDVKETEPGQRIGLALKGVEAGELKRGYVISDRPVECKKHFSVEAAKSRFSKFEFAAGKRLMVSIGLQAVSGTIKAVSGKSLEIEMEAPIAAYGGKCLLLATDSTPRVIGSGRIA